MCLNPISLRNPAKYELGGLEFIKVPCRHCQECADVASNDYVVRTIALFNSLKDYSFFFCTLTFNEDNCPRTTIYENKNGKWDPIEYNVRCFNHEIYRRFRKNFNEYWRDKFGKPAYLLTTCEFGEHSTKRPHYHCIVAVPYPCLDYRTFKSIIERYWHYGFTKDINIAMKDGIFYERSLINRVKYVTKYVSKFNTKLPYYLLSDKYCTDYLPHEIRPRVFISKGYGSCLSDILTHSNYVHNSVMLEFEGKKKNYSIPSYYLRKYFVRTEQKIIDSYFPKPQGFPYDSKLPKRKKYIKQSKSFRINGYDNVLFNHFKDKVSSLIFHYNDAIVNDEEFRKILPTMYEDEKFYYKGDWSLSPSLLDDMTNYYLQAGRPSPLSPLPLSSPREKIRCRLLLKHPINSYSYCVSEYKYKKGLQRKHGLPWLDMPSIPHTIMRLLSYSMPPDWQKLEYYEHYTRNKRLHQSILKAENDMDWLKTHHIPYKKTYVRA